MPLFTGLGVAMITAFDENGINFDAQGKIIDHLLNGGTDAIVVCGTTGEPSTMTKPEREDLIAFTVQRVAGRIPVYAGSGGNNTAESVDFSRRCQELGADGLLVVTPYYNKCTQKGLIAHFAAISDAVSIPMIAYNVPTRTNVNILPETALKLAEIKNVVAIKEASGDIHQISEVLRLTKGKLDIYSGDDSLTVPAMALGALGVISVAGNVVPKEMREMTQLALTGNFSAASDIHFNLAPLMKLLFCEVNPIPVKYAMNLLGFNAGIPRMPLTEMEPQNAEKLRAEMERLGLI
ncbi:MAG: 4-hydroxy-tetrahydrodipicolinate synthase [Firmicutes bacterium]|nr:4-hydroxy-tetrahydrodipicolinate synthase [Bacillota bacterium]